jgi:hypothetical protein
MPKKYKKGGKVDSTKFDPEGKGYDYLTAEASGGKPDSTGHWSSLDPRTGMVLKGKGHSTWDLTVKKETELGNKIIKKADGRYYSTPDTSVKKYKRGGKADTVPAMLTPGEVVLNEKQQKALEKYIGQSREEIFGKIKVPGFNIGGKVKKYYQKGGEVKPSKAHRKWKMSVSARHRAKRLAREKAKLEMSPREFRKTLGGKAPDIDNDLWEQYIKGGRLVLPKLLAEQKNRDKLKKAKEKASRMKAAGYKLPPGLEGGGKVKKAYARMYQAKWGG